MAGRPNKYETHVKPKLFLVECWARDGLSDEQIAKNLGIATSSYCQYKKIYSEFSEALSRGKEIVDYEVENALLKRALGFEYTEEKVEISKRGKKITQTVKMVVPDTTAASIWLYNRSTQKWKAKPQEDTEEIEDLSGIRGEVFGNEKD